MKRMILLFLALVTALSCAGCGMLKQKEPEKEPELSQMKTICELAVMKCYYHNVAKFTQEDAAGFLLWKKDKHFWIEYGGVVSLGVDASQMDMEISPDGEVTITLPPAKVLSCQVDSSSLGESSYVVDDESAKVTAEDETKAFTAAQQKLQETAEADKALLAEAQQRVKTLLAGYVENIGTAFKKTYTITWRELDEGGSQAGESGSAPASAAPEESQAPAE